MRYRTISVSLWLAPKFKRLTPDQKLLLLHLLSGPHANVSGLYCHPLLYIAHETGLSIPAVKKAMAGLVRTGFAHWDEASETVWAVGMLEFQGGGAKILKAVADQVESLPPSPVVDAFRVHYQHLDIPYRYPIDGASSKEKEKEEEKDCAEFGAASSPASEAEEQIPCDEIICYLNEKTGKRFRSSTVAYRKAIRARWQEGARFEDFRLVIDNMVRLWAHKPEMQTYLRPETLFGPKFDSYLNSAAAAPAAVGEAYLPFKEEDRDYEAR